MQFPTIDFGWLGNGNLIGMMAVLHVMINHAVAIGGSILMVSLEYAAVKTGNARLEQYAKWLSKWILIITTTAGAMTGVGIWFTTTVILPNAIGSLLRIFHWAWFTEWLVFVSEVILLLTYYYTWDRWKGDRKKLHLRTGLALCIMSWFTLVIITGVLAAQLNPGNWVETLSFWSAFLNPTWVPSTLFRTFAAIALGVALLTPLNRWRVKHPLDRASVQRIYGKWLIVSVPCMLVSGWWYLRTLPEQAQTLVVWASGMSDFAFAFLNAAGLLLILVFGIMLLDGRTRHPLALSVFTAIFSLALITEFEIVRENIRKPYVIYNYMYANGILKSDVERFKRDGALAQSTFSKVKQVTEENKLEAGEELFRMQCIACHSIDGPRRSRVMTERAKGWSEEALAAFIPQMHMVRPVMPPFAGTDEEVKALAAYIHKIVAERSDTP
ncbi:Cytochrome C oxidase, cbb3-type, subunit III [Paenibacillus sp. UNCCL117]|uniref:c-type cytochrome n=1 Tax=unclassified Paenibacillus TaxID=185978 RepID=UPI00088F60DE|nr:MULTISPECIES: c-type cytochrome [unclassified Paenibacillus]SDD96758.1 Cytochrome C oxidase, cbb3-type, subunit III [Paenibacillus sp. cl123]SFW56322.1 Cytochrome C oxidase, cbb3-type, subunit III [Paenibacillus sp. UNCCL117]